jgi:predicted amidohydrolase
VKYRAALVQMRSGRDMARNLADAEALIRAAAGLGARLVTTPEMTNIIEPDRPRLRALVQVEADDPAVRRLADLAASLGLWLHAGSLALRGAEGGVVNRGLLFAPDGRIAARYDKIHLFDVDLPTGERLRESEAITPGDRAVVARTELGSLGLSICYDLRFPALYRALARAGAEVLLVPSAFTVPTGEAHWHALLRARAIETGSFVLAAAQGGSHDSGRRTYGHSLAVSPWGDVLAEGGIEPGIIAAEIDGAAAAAARRRIPALQHDRAFALKRPDVAANQKP